MQRISEAIQIKLQIVASSVMTLSKLKNLFTILYPGKPGRLVATYIESSMISDMIGVLSDHITDGLILLYRGIHRRCGLSHLPRSPSRQVDHPPTTAKVDQSNKIINVPKAVGHPNRQLDLVIGSLDSGIGDLVRHGGDNRIYMTSDLTLELDEFRNPARPGSAAPFLQCRPNFLGREVKDCPETFLQSIGCG